MVPRVVLLLSLAAAAVPSAGAFAAPRPHAPRAVAPTGLRMSSREAFLAQAADAPAASTTVRSTCRALPLKQRMLFIIAGHVIYRSRIRPVGELRTGCVR